MNPFAFRALWVLAAVLLATIAYEVSNEVWVGNTQVVGARPPDAADTPIGPPPSPPIRTAEWAETSLARPLFSPDRRPAPPGTAAVAAVPGATVLPRLTAILVTPDEKSAIFAGLEAGPPLVLREGGRIAGFTVTSIDQQQVILMDSNGPRLLRTRFGSSTPPPQSAGSSSPSASAIPSVARAVGVAGAPLGARPTPPSTPSNLPFERNPAPSGLDILLNLDRTGTTATTRP